MIPWEFKWLFKYLERHSALRKLKGLPTEGVDYTLARMRKAMKTGHTCYVSYACGNLFFGWSIKQQRIFTKSGYGLGAWDPITSAGVRWTGPRSKNKKKKE